ncbi:MAG: alpha/beta fold hydrolase [Solirubrobacteraceae bacterium]
MALAFDRRGEGPPLLLLHPLGADRRVWDPVLHRLTPERDVISLDLPGFGSSPPLGGPEPPTPAALAAAIAGFLDDLGVPAPHVAGNSLGGWIALELALAGNARSVTAIAPAGLWPQPLMPKRGIARVIAGATLGAMPALVRSPAGRRVVLGGLVAHPERVPPAAALALVRAYATAPGLGAVNDAMRANRFTGLERIRVPVTLAWAERDRLVAPPAHVAPSVHTRILADCGHLAMWDDPGQVANVLLAGSASHGGARRSATAVI